MSVTDVRPTDNNVNGSCSAVFDRNTISYDVTFYITFDETFTPAVISAINGLRVTRFEIDIRGTPIPGTVVRVLTTLDSLEQGPVTVGIPFQDLPQLFNGHGYSLHVSYVTCIQHIIIIIAMFPDHSVFNDVSYRHACMICIYTHIYTCIQIMCTIIKKCVVALLYESILAVISFKQAS